MKKFAFVSDFDGTLTDKDFYHIVIEKYLSDWGHSFYEEWRKTKKINVEFLNKIFGSMDRDEQEILEDIMEIPLDPYATQFIRNVEQNGGDFYILSAGTSYYINKLLEHLGINNVTVISMRGIYKDRGIEIIPDKESEYYSDIFGLDKAKVIRKLKQQYERVFFAGDSEPDMLAAKEAHCAFAKSQLQDLLTKENINFVPFSKYIEVEKYLIENRLV